MKIIIFFLEYTLEKFTSPFWRKVFINKIEIKIQKKKDQILKNNYQKSDTELTIPFGEKFLSKRYIERKNLIIIMKNEIFFESFSRIYLGEICQPLLEKSSYQKEKNQYIKKERKYLIVILLLFIKNEIPWRNLLVPFGEKFLSKRYIERKILINIMKNEIFFESIPWRNLLAPFGEKFLSKR